MIHFIVEKRERETGMGDRGSSTGMVQVVVRRGEQSDEAAWPAKKQICETLFQRKFLCGRLA